MIVVTASQVFHNYIYTTSIYLELRVGSSDKCQVGKLFQVIAKLIIFPPLGLLGSPLINLSYPAHSHGTKSVILGPHSCNLRKTPYRFFVVFPCIFMPFSGLGFLRMSTHQNAYRAEQDILWTEKKLTKYI